MFYKFVYQTKDGKKVYSNEKQDRDDLELVFSVSDGQMKSKEIIQK